MTAPGSAPVSRAAAAGAVLAAHALLDYEYPFPTGHTYVCACGEWQGSLSSLHRAHVAAALAAAGLLADPDATEAAQDTADPADGLRTRIEALDARWCESISHGTERGEAWVPWLIARVRELREALAVGDAETDSECGSCGESPNDECPLSKRPCGHHCNHVWIHDACHWCGVEFGEDAAAARQRPTRQADTDRAAVEGAE